MKDNYLFNLYLVDDSKVNLLSFYHIVEKRANNDTYYANLYTYVISNENLFKNDNLVLYDITSKNNSILIQES